MATWVTMLPCLRSGNSLVYSDRDTATARCRLSKRIFKQYKANIGWIFHFEVTIPGSGEDLEEESRSFEVLCTAWPQINNNANENMEERVFLDDSVIKGRHFLWWDGKCRILRAHPPNPCHTVRCCVPLSSIHGGKEFDLVASVFGGFPVANGFQLTSSPSASFKSAARQFTVQSFPPGQYGVIDVMTLLMAASKGCNEALSSGTSSGSTGDQKASSQVMNAPRASSTGVVHTLIRNCIFPSILMPAQQLFTSGLLLSGPPGVGKTYAITAVKEICKEICDIKIHNLCIPDILADENPIAHVENLLSSAKCLLPQTTSRQQRQASLLPSSNGKHTHTSTSTPNKLKLPLTPSSTPRTPGNSSASYSPSPTPSARFSWLSPSPQKPNTSSSSPLYKTPGSHSKAITPSSSSSSLLSFLSPSVALPSSVALSEVHVVMLDEVDALGGAGEMNVTNAVQHTIKHLLCTWMDAQAALQLQSSGQSAYAPIVVIATSNRPSDVDPCFLRGGRLEKEIDISESSVMDREQILHGLLTSALPVILEKARSSGSGDDTVDVDIDSGSIDGTDVNNMVAVMIPTLAKDIAMSTGGYVAADLSALISEVVAVQQTRNRTQAHSFSQDVSKPLASATTSSPSTCSTSTSTRLSLAVEDQPIRLFNASQKQLKDLVMSAVQIAKKTVAPSCLRGATIELPNLTYDDVIGYSEVKKNLSRVLSFSSAAARAKLVKFGQNTMLGGVLLHGPPGNSKTRLVQAAAAMHGLPMISLSSADVYSAYVGDSEAEIRRVFTLARQSHPCVLFMDEIDALVTNRQEESSSNNVESRVLSTLLNEMDGIDGGGNGVFVIAATNRIDFIDSALLRKGRFHHLLHVPLPNIDEKKQLLNYFAKRFGIDATAVDAIIPKLSNVNISGADVENLCREAGMTKIRNFISQSRKMNGHDNC